MKTTTSLTHTNHSREFGQFRYIYPVLSRRSKGISIGINLNPDKVCNFDCIYCQVDRTIPGTAGLDPDQLEEELRSFLERVKDGSLFSYAPFDTVLPSMHRVNDIAFAGDGEPTAAREFGDIVDRVIRLKRDMDLPTIKIVVITNATLLLRPAVREALNRLSADQGEVWGKLDAGTEMYYQKIAATHIPFRTILKNLTETAKRLPMVIQSLFLETVEGPPPPDEVLAYCERLREIVQAGGDIRLVQIYTIARKPPGAGIYALPDNVLERIAAQVRGKTGLYVETYYGARMFMKASGEAESSGDAANLPQCEG